MLKLPGTEEVVAPTYLGGVEVEDREDASRRESLADWVVARDNPYFARAITNRIWANFFNVGLVEDVDDLRVSNPASNERLLTALADYLVEHEYDLRRLMRAILTSSTYARSSLVTEKNQVRV